MKAAVFATYSMDHQDQTSIRGIPRLTTRLPMPRASHDNLRSLSPPRALKPVASRDTLRSVNLSSLPRPRTLVPQPLGENKGNSIRSRYAWTASAPDAVVEQKSDQKAIFNQPETLDTTPPGPKSVIPSFENSGENVSKEIAVDENVTPRLDDQKQKRRPRPSLSERTVETLTQLSPSPSPAGRKSRTSSIDSVMGPPSRPASSMKVSRPPTSSSMRSNSPTKVIKAPVSIANTKKPLSSPFAQSPGNIYTPPKAHVRGHSAHVAKAPRYFSATAKDSHHASSHKNVATLSKEAPISGPKFTKPTKTIDGRTSPVKPSLAAIFKDPPKVVPTNNKLDLSSLSSKPTGLMRPKTRGENPLAASPNTSPASSKAKKQPAKQALKEPEETTNKSAKSSAALRDQVAKAKAEALKKSTRPASSLENIEETSFIVADNKGQLRKRVQGAITSGILNISAMGLKQIPDEVMKMYDFNESSTTNWSEAVDLVKFIAADNDLQELRPDSFPDWSVEDLAEDDEKSNQFGGLEVLDLHGNQLQEIPVGFRRLERLQTLNLSKNKLSLPALEVICQVKSLKELRLANNALAGKLLENIGHLTNLEVLDLSSNQLGSLPTSISNLTKLKKLNVSDNKFETLTFELLSKLPLVEILASRNKLSGNLLSTSAEFRFLLTLDLSHNLLESVVLESDILMPNLLALNLDGNRLSSLPAVSSTTNLTTLTASNNKLTEFPAGFEQLTAARHVDLSNNNIKIVPTAIAQMEKLSNLNLAGNPLRERKYLTMNTDDLKLDLAQHIAPAENSTNDSSFVALPSSASPSSDKPQTRYMYKPTNGKLDLSSKSLSEIDPTMIDLSTPVHTLNLSANNFSTLPMTLLTHPLVQPSLHTLDISHNPLSESSYLSQPLTLPSLHTLNIISTGMTTLDPLTSYLKAPALTTLNISCHRLSGHLPWPRAFWPSVTTLLATDNWFSSIDVEAVRGLEVLDVRNNEIEALPPKLGMLAVNTNSRKKNDNSNNNGKSEAGRLRSFECAGNRFRVPRWEVVERGTDAVLKDLRRMVPAGELDAEWADE